jgi:predicted ATPase
MFHMTRGNLVKARTLGEKLLALTSEEQDSARLLEAHRAIGAALLNIGEFVPAREHLERASALYDVHQHRALLFQYGQDLGVSSLIQLARALWYLGYPEQARRRMQEALQLAHELAHPFTLALALIFANWLYQFRREEMVIQELVAALLALSTEHHFPIGIAFGKLFRGWSLAELGQREDGFAEARSGLAAMQAGNIRLGQPYAFTILAEMCGQRGAIEDGFNALNEALTMMSQSGEHSYEAEVYRITGELTRQKSEVRGPGSEVSTTKQPTPSTEAEVSRKAEENFLKAIDIAQHQHAKSFELRATVSLARLWQQQGKISEAHHMLSTLYNWFTEGFDTKDLQEAKSLLGELAEGHV